jgi:dipeptidyl aminopeptidase/acylaminoacyl peptidase
MIPTLAATLAVAGITRAGAHAAIRRGLKAAREEHVDTPAHLGLHASEVRIATRNHKHLFSWFIAAESGVPAPAVVVMHGWGANASLMLPVARPLHRAGFAVLLLDARGHGRSDEDDFASLPRFAEDIEHGLDWLHRQPGIDAARCGVLGHSVGAGAALLAATRRPDVAAVVSVSAFAHPEEVMRRMLAQLHVPYPVIGWYVLRHVQRMIGCRFGDIAPVNTIARVPCPVLLAHGTEDRTVPFADATRILAAGRRDRIRLVALPGGHDTRAAMAQHAGTMIRFLDRTLAGDGAGGSFLPERAREGGASGSTR